MDDICIREERKEGRAGGGILYKEWMTTVDDRNERGHTQTKYSRQIYSSV